MVGTFNLSSQFSELGEELATIDLDVFPWIDGNDEICGEPNASVRRFELNLLL